MTSQTHKVATDALETLGTHPIPDNSGRDAIHLAVEPVVAGMSLKAGDRIELIDGEAFYTSKSGVGIVDPFVEKPVREGERFWLVVLPRTITSLRHVWSHPMFAEGRDFHADADDHYVARNKAVSEKWMSDWAMKHVSDDYYGGGDRRTEADAFAFAVLAGHETHIGPYESARDHIDNEWWEHWEAITGTPGKRGEYFSCSC